MALAQEDYLIAAPQMEALPRLRQAASRLGWSIREEAGASLFLLRRGERGAWIFGWECRLAVCLRPERDRTVVRLTVWGGAELDPHASIWHVLSSAGLVPSLVEPVIQSAEGLRRPASWTRVLTPWWAKSLNLVRYFAFLPFVTLVTLGVVLNALLGWYWAGLVCLLLYVVLVTLPSATEDILARRMMGVRSRQGILSAAALSAAWGVVLGLVVAAIAYGFH